MTEDGFISSDILYTVTAITSGLTSLAEICEDALQYNKIFMSHLFGGTSMFVGTNMDLIGAEGFLGLILHLP